MTDKINTTHPDYDKNVSRWNKCAIITEGEDSVKAAGTAFLPRLKGQDEDDYKSYKERASFYNASGRTVDALVGIALRKPPQIVNWNESKMDFFDSVTRDNKPFDNFVQEDAFQRMAATGKFGILLDLSENASITDYPYMSLYNAQSIINWKKKVSKETGKEVFVLVVLRESEYVESSENKYRMEELVTYRELYIDEDTGNYTYRIWKPDPDNKAKYIPGEEKVPNISKKPFNYIPFVEFDKDRPPILDIVNINISHYRTSADLEHGRHFTALPTPWVAGFKIKDNGVLYMGSPYAWVAEDPSANAGMLEYTGQGLSALEKAIEQKQQQMAILGARMLEDPKKAVEATDTHKLRTYGEKSVLADLVELVEEGFNVLLGWAAEWINIKQDGPVTEFNKDFDTLQISPEMLKSMFEIYQGGGISFNTFFFNLKKGEVYQEDTTPEEELNNIAYKPYALPSFTEEDEGLEDEE